MLRVQVLAVADSKRAADSLSADTTVGATPVSVTIPVPAGSYKAAWWSLTIREATGAVAPKVRTGAGSPAPNAAAFPAASPAAFPFTFPDLAVTSPQLLDIQSAAGGTLTLTLETATATFGYDAGDFTLLLLPGGGTVRGMPSPGDVREVLDNLAGLLARSWSTIGRGDPAETGTLSAYARRMNRTLRGDGTAQNPGLDHQGLKDTLRDPLYRFQGLLRYDTLYRANDLQIIRALENAISANLPAWRDTSGFTSGWRFVSAAAAQFHALDAFLLRANGFSGPGNSKAPGVALPVASATVVPQGAVGAVAAADAPSAVFTYVGAYDWQESLPSAVIPLTALSGSQNAWLLGGTAWTTLTPAALPTGTRLLRVYRTAVGQAASGVYAWDQDVPIAGLANLPPITLAQADAQLRPDILPPLWGRAMPTPEAATLYGCAFGVFPTQPGEQAGPVQYQSAGMLSPENVVLIPTDDLLGEGNPPSSGRFGQAVVTGATAITYTPGSIQTINNALNNLQGFGGGQGVQGRVTTPLTAAGSVAIAYTYFDATNGWGVAQTATSAAATFNGTDIGSLVTWLIPTGRVVRMVTGLSGAAGFGAGGAFDIEAAPPRAY
jgi:hypothetical protein